MPITKFGDIVKADVKAYFGVATSDTSKDAQIDLLLPIVTARIREYCRHDFEVVTVTNEEPKVMENADTFFVTKRPVVTLTSITENGIALVEGTDFVLYKDEGRFVRCSSYMNNIFSRPYGGVWDSTQGAVIVSYTGGEALTFDVVQVFYEMVGIYCGLRTRAYITNAGIENVVQLNDVPKEFYAILELHKKARTL